MADVGTHTTPETQAERTVELLATALRVIAQGSWNVGRGELISANEYARAALMVAGLEGSPPLDLGDSLGL